MNIQIDTSAHVHPTTRFHGNASVGFCSYVGYEAPEATETEPVCVGDGVLHWRFLSNRGRSASCGPCRGRSLLPNIVRFPDRNGNPRALSRADLR